MHAVIDNQSRDPMDEPAGARLPNPQVRTLLLTDLCDSTMLVERLGDNAAAELFRAHDRLVLQLQQQWRGRLIDRSDGLLLLFERAIDGLGFALDYARGLRELGQRAEVTKAGVELRARAGLHVGEVLTWRNSDAAVNVGAKPLEVEGLAKPMAGRLMTLARPGQILLSATAEPLAHRAARELGERGETLLWKSHGRWRFKGVPQAQEVYEVGEPGITPLRAPQQNRAKAWRDIPLWRRPAALAAELLLVAGLVGGGWFLTRPQPAIAFGERDWVVVGDLRNLTGDKLLDESLEQAFRISLEQSRYVNVLSDLKARDTLERMRRKPDTVLDRAVSSEIALRDGARAVILPTVAEIGGRIRVSAEVIDPHTQTTVYAESADGSGVQSTLHSIDKVTAALRGKLGEALQSIQRNSVSLPNVTTSNLDALKAYALGRKYSAEGDGKQAIAYYQRAVRLDPEFALAMVAAGGSYVHVLGDIPSGNREFTKALRLRGRLSPRDALKLDAAVARLGPPGPAIERWRQLLELYPDESGAHMALGQLELWGRNDLESALAHARAAAVPQADRPATAYYLQGIVLVGLGRINEAMAAFKHSREMGYKGAGYTPAYAFAAGRDWAGAERALAQRMPTGTVTGELAMPDQRAMFALDRGDWDQAARLAEEGVRQAMASEPLYAGQWLRIRALVIDVLAARAPRDSLVARIGAEMDHVDAHSAQLDAQAATSHAFAIQALGYLAARLDSESLLRRAIETTTNSRAMADDPLAQQLDEVLQAEGERLRGNAAHAASRLKPLAGSPEGLAIVHASRMHALRAAGASAGASAEAHWLATHRARAYVEQPAADLLWAVPIFDSTLGLLVQAEAARDLGQHRVATQQRAAFTAIWDPTRLPEPLQKRLAALDSIAPATAGALH